MASAIDQSSHPLITRIGVCDTGSRLGPAPHGRCHPVIVVINLVSMTCCYRDNDDHSPVLADTDHLSPGGALELACDWSHDPQPGL